MKKMNIKFDKNIPLPSAKAKYPLGEMEVGDSFAVPYDNAPQLRSAATSAPKMNPSCQGMKFSTRTLKEKGEKVLRVWRIE